MGFLSSTLGKLLGRRESSAAQYTQPVPPATSTRQPLPDPTPISTPGIRDAETLETATEAFAALAGSTLRRPDVKVFIPYGNHETTRRFLDGIHQILKRFPETPLGAVSIATDFGESSVFARTRSPVERDAAGHITPLEPVTVEVNPQWVEKPYEDNMAAQQEAYQELEAAVSPKRALFRARFGLTDHVSPPNLYSPTGAGAHEATHAVADTLANSNWMSAGVVAGHPNALMDDVKEGVGARLGIPQETVTTAHVLMVLGPGIVRGPDEMVADSGADVALRGERADPINRRIIGRLAAAVDGERTWRAITRSTAAGARVTITNDLKTAAAGLAPVSSVAVNSGMPAAGREPVSGPRAPLIVPAHHQEAKGLEKSQQKRL